MMGLLRVMTVVVAVAVASVPTVGLALGESTAFTFDEWRRAVAETGLDPDEVVYPFHATDEMRAWVDGRLKDYVGVGSSIQLRALQEELFNRDVFEFAYDEELTLTAEEAFHARRGNCMSFTALFIALTRSLGVPTKLVSVRKSPEVEKADGLVVINRHVVAGYRSADKLHLYDFYVTSAAPYMQHWIIDDLHASAMYHTNRGGAAIRAGRLDEAMHHLQIATTLAPDWGPGWVNLGVAHYRLGAPEAAMAAYQNALQVDPDNSSALTNMAYVYRQLGREDEARAALAAAAQSTSNPFTLIAMADVEMLRGNLAKAASYLRRARWWYRTEPEVYDAMARLARLESDHVKAERFSMKAARLRAESAAADEVVDAEQRSDQQLH